jgi:hypothetical protein
MHVPTLESFALSASNAWDGGSSSSRAEQRPLARRRSGWSREELHRNGSHAGSHGAPRAGKRVGEPATETSSYGPLPALRP